MDRVAKMVNVAGAMGLAALGLALTLSCSQAKVTSEQKWLGFRCPDG
jgi:hypothetical protein